MNTIVKYFFVLLLLCIAQYSVVGQSKNGQGNANGHDKNKGKGPSGENDVIMIHGINGEDDSDEDDYRSFWQRYDESVTKLTTASGKAKKVRIPIYDTKDGIVKGYENLTNKDETDAVNANVVIPNRNAYWSAAHTNKKARPIGIAHSMGGLVMREWQKEEKYFKVLMAVGSPLDGSLMANNVMNGNMEEYLSQNLSRVTAGPSICNVPPITVAIVALINPKYAALGGIPILSSLAISLAALLVPPWYVNREINTSLKEFQEESNYIQQWKNGTKSIKDDPSPRIVVYGQESSLAHYRIFASFVDKYDYADGKYYHFSTVIPALYLSAAAINVALAVISYAAINPILGAYFTVGAAAWTVGIFPWLGPIGNGWRENCNGSEYDEEYDGLVPGRSQRGEQTNFPTAGHPEYILEAKGVNHAEMGNTDNDVKTHIENLMLGRIVTTIDSDK